MLDTVHPAKSYRGLSSFALESTVYVSKEMQHVQVGTSKVFEGMEKGLARTSMQQDGQGVITDAGEHVQNRLPRAL